jgi:cytochrome d ubiquinol oxidase subunit I
VTEWGRQPFTIRDVMRTADAVTPVGNIAVPFVAFTILYLFLAAMVIVLLRRQIAQSPPASELRAPSSAGGVA